MDRKEQIRVQVVGPVPAFDDLPEINKERFARALLWARELEKEEQKR